MTQPEKSVFAELSTALGGIEQIKESHRLKGTAHDPILDEVTAAIERALNMIQRARCEAMAQLDRL